MLVSFCVTVRIHNMYLFPFLVVSIVKWHAVTTAVLIISALRGFHINNYIYSMYMYMRNIYTPPVPYTTIEELNKLFNFRIRSTAKRVV